ncbi:MAG TPA: hypothetical protein GXX46_06050 [Peptococcaceae bacterium]|nr:hypothetical protein [Peptococcaceae bacterium]
MQVPKVAGTVTFSVADQEHSKSLVLQDGTNTFDFTFPPFDGRVRVYPVLVDHYGNVTETDFNLILHHDLCIFVYNKTRNSICGWGMTMIILETWTAACWT